MYNNVLSYGFWVGVVGLLFPLWKGAGTVKRRNRACNKTLLQGFQDECARFSRKMVTKQNQCLEGSQFPVLTQTPMRENEARDTNPSRAKLRGFLKGANLEDTTETTYSGLVLVALPHQTASWPRMGQSVCLEVVLVWWMFCPFLWILLAVVHSASQDHDTVINAISSQSDKFNQSWTAERVTILIWLTWLVNN